MLRQYANEIMVVSDAASALVAFLFQHGSSTKWILQKIIALLPGQRKTSAALRDVTLCGPPWLCPFAGQLLVHFTSELCGLVILTEVFWECKISTSNISEETFPPPLKILLHRFTSSLLSNHDLLTYSFQNDTISSINYNTQIYFLQLCKLGHDRRTAICWPRKLDLNRANSRNVALNLNNIPTTTAWRLFHHTELWHISSSRPRDSDL